MGKAMDSTAENPVHGELTFPGEKKKNFLNRIFDHNSS
jgi:hypothetical protein